MELPIAKVPPEAVLIAVGDELVLGASQDTNSRFAAQLFTTLGLPVRGFQVVRDEVEDIVRAVKKGLMEAEVVVLSGGLGPTGDDVTREAVARAVGVELLERPELLAGIEAKFRARGRAMPEANRQQARIPAGAEAIDNPLGTAPGILIHRGSRMIVSLPGVPFEFCNMLEATVLPAIQAKYGTQLAPTSTRTLLVTGVSESALDARIRRFMDPTANPRLGINAKEGALTLRMVASAPDPGRADAILDGFEAELRDLLGPDACLGHPGTPEEALRDLPGFATVAVADAVTGGSLAARLLEAGIEVHGWVGRPSGLRRELPALAEDAGAVEAAAAAAARAGVEAGLALWPGEAGFLFVAAAIGEAAYERVVVPSESPEVNRWRCEAVVLDLARRLGQGLPAPEDAELEALAALAEEPAG